VSAARVYKAHNPLTAAVGGETGLHVSTALKSAEEQVKRLHDPMRDSLRAWITEILELASQPAPDQARLAWLANGVFGVAGACELDALSRCGGLLGRAIQSMNQSGWRSDAVRLYAASMARLLDGASKPEEQAVLASLEAMNNHLAESSAGS